MEWIILGQATPSAGGDVIPGSSLHLVLGGLATLSSVVVYLWRQYSTDKVRTETKLDECEKSHQAVNKQLLDVTAEFGQKMAVVHEELGVMKGKIAILSSTVLDRVHNDGNDRGRDSGVS